MQCDCGCQTTNAPIRSDDVSRDRGKLETIVNRRRRTDIARVTGHDVATQMNKKKEESLNKTETHSLRGSLSLPGRCDLAFFLGKADEYYAPHKIEEALMYTLYEPILGSRLFTPPSKQEGKSRDFPAFPSNPLANFLYCPPHWCVFPGFLPRTASQVGTELTMVTGHNFRTRSWLTAEGGKGMEGHGLPLSNVITSS